MSAKHEKKQEQVWLQPAVETVKGGVMAVASSIAILALMSAVKATGALAAGTGAGFVAAACVLGALIGGLFAAGRCRRGKLPVGVGVGAVALLIQLTVGTFFLGGVSGAWEVRNVCLSCLLGGALAGVLSAAGSGRKQRSR